MKEVHILVKLESFVLLLETTSCYHKQEVFVIQNPFDIFNKHKTLHLKCNHRQLL
jgi:hypothetical protein